MLHVSDDWKAYTEDNHNFEIKAVLTLEDGTVFNLTGDDFMSACINDAVSDRDSITIGAVITNRFSGSLNNMNDKFTGLDLEGATLEVKAGLIYEDLSEEWIDKGTYILDQPSAMGDVLQISAYDYMDKMNRYYMGTHPVDGVQTQITFPIDSETLASYLCDYCGVSYDPGFWQIANNLQVEEFEFNESTTCRQVLGWVLQINCGYARINNLGELEVKWMGEGYWSLADDLDGGTIQPWAADDTADGGIMDPWAVVPDIEGGYICVTVDKVLSVDMAAKDVKITGIRAYAYNTVEEFDFTTSGSSGYVMAIEGNPLITTDRTSEVANAINGTINGMGFRPYDARIEANPCLEAGDTIALMDYKGKYHISLITNLTFNWGAAMSISCGAESVSKKDLELSNPTTSVIQGAVTAAYDYITAKKISADYITAGTIEASVIATDFTMEGGKINITTEGRDDNKIELQWHADLISRNTILMPTGMKCLGEYYSAGQNSEANFYTGGLTATNTYSGNTYYAQVTPNEFMMRTDTTIKASITSAGNGVFVGSVTASSFINSSRLDLKKNLQHVDSVLDKIKSADILKFNFKDEAEDAKPHLGLAIGDDYNTPDEVIALDEEGKEQGVDLYAMVSMAWKAIQEQQEIIETLEARVEALEKKLNPIGTIKDIIKGDTDGNTN